MTGLAKTTSRRQSETLPCAVAQAAVLAPRSRAGTKPLLPSSRIHQPQLMKRRLGSLDGGSSITRSLSSEAAEGESLTPALSPHLKDLMIRSHYQPTVAAPRQT